MIASPQGSFRSCQVPCPSCPPQRGRRGAAKSLVLALHHDFVVTNVKINVQITLLSHTSPSWTAVPALQVGEPERPRAEQAAPLVSTPM